MLNDYFISVLTDETEINRSEIPEAGENVEHVLKDIHWDPEDVREKLMKLKMNKASGPDLINVCVLKNCL